MSQDALINNKGGYRRLVVYRFTEIIYDVTYYFTKRFLDRRDRTADQMIRGARSGQQNFAEASKILRSSAEPEIKLMKVAKASLEGLLLDYEDYLRLRHLELWDMNHPRHDGLRSYCRSENFMTMYNDILPKLNDEEICNMAIMAINQAMYLLRRMIENMQQPFVRKQKSGVSVFYGKYDFKMYDK